MGLNKDQKALRKNAPGRARNRAREATASTAGADNDEEVMWPDIECPKCYAEPGDPCTTPSGNPAKKAHAARLK